MNKVRTKKVRKLTVKELKEALEDVPDDREIVLGFYMKDKPVYFVYLAEILADLSYDGVLGEKLDKTKIVELCGFDHEFCKYLERE